MHTISKKQIMMLKPQEIKVPFSRPRKKFSSKEMKVLAASISVNGIIEPLLVRKISGRKYELIAGERRLKAAIFVGLRRIPCVVHNVDNRTAAIYAVLENFNTELLDSEDIRRAITRLILKYKMSNSELCANLGLQQKELSNLLYCEPQKIVEAQEKRISINETVQLSSSEVEKPEQKKKIAIGDTRLFANSLYKMVETLKIAGINATLRKTENEKFVEYRIKIKKEDKSQKEYKQLKIC